MSTISPSPKRQSKGKVPAVNGSGRKYLVGFEPRVKKEGVKEGRDDDDAQVRDLLAPHSYRN